MKKFSIIFFLPLFVFSCQSFDIVKRPKVSIEKFDIDSLTLRDITFLFDIGIENPYPIGLKLDDITITFSIEGNRIVQTKTGKGFRVRANGKESTMFKANLRFDDIIKFIRGYAQRDYLDCNIDVDILLPLPQIPGLEKYSTFKYNLKKKIPAIKPTIFIEKFTVRKPSVSEIDKALKRAGKDLNPETVSGMLNDIFTGKKVKPVIDPSILDLTFGVDFDIRLRNNTKSRILFDSLEYQFFLDGNQLIAGETENIKNTANESTIKISNNFKSSELSKNILNIFSRKHSAFSLKGFTILKLPDYVTKNSVKLTFDEKGLVQLQ
jgi:LEA14-like dessication related protein